MSNAGGKEGDANESCAAIATFVEMLTAPGDLSRAVRVDV